MTLVSTAQQLNTWYGLGGIVLFDPEIVSDNINIDIFGIGTGNTLFVNNFNGTIWTDWREIEGTITSKPSAVKIDSNTHVLARGGDSSLYQIIYNGSVWGSWISYGKVLAADSSPFAFVYDNNVHALITDTDNHVHRIITTSTLPTWEDLLSPILTPNTLTALVSTTTNMPDPSPTIDIFARGEDATLKHLRWNKSTNSWMPWESVGGAIIGKPCVVNMNNLIYVYVRGLDNNLWVNTYNGTTWSGYQNLGGILSSDPTFSYTNTSKDIYVIGADSSLWYYNLESNTWNGLGGIIKGNPISITFNDKEYTFVRATDNSVWYTVTIQPWKCSGSPSYTCYQVADGTFPSQAKCQAACAQWLDKKRCVGTLCISNKYLLVGAGVGTALLYMKMKW